VLLAVLSLPPAAFLVLSAISLIWLESNPCNVLRGIEVRLNQRPAHSGTVICKAMVHFAAVGQL
jgi:hypothetical protein